MPTDAPPPPPNDPTQGLRLQAASAVEELVEFVALFAHELGQESLHAPPVLDEFAARLQVRTNLYLAKLRVLLAMSAGVAGSESCVPPLVAAREEMARLTGEVRTAFYGERNARTRRPADRWYAGPASAAQDPRVKAALDVGAAAAGTVAARLRALLADGWDCKVG